MSNLIEIAVIIAVIGWQHFTGYLKNKYLGALLPIIFTATVLFFLFKGQLHLNFSDIVMPIFGLVVLLGMYTDGSHSKEKKVQRELEKMKATDLSDNNN